MLFFKRKPKKLTPPMKRTPDERPFQVYEISERKKAPEKQFRKSEFVSPIFGKNVKDDVVIPIKTDLRHNLDKMDAFRTKPRMTKEERIQKYGSAYPEFDLVRGKNLDEVVQSSRKRHEPQKIVEASIIDNTQTEKTAEPRKEPGYKTSVRDFYEETPQTEATPSKQSEQEEHTPQERVHEKAPATQTESIRQPNQEEESQKQEETESTPNSAEETSEETEEKPKRRTPREPDKTKQTVKTGTNTYEHYQIPPISLFSAPNDDPVDLSESVEKQTNRINETFHEFAVGARVFTHTQGPTVTRYEIAVEKGVKLNKITNLTDNLKMALEAKQIRLEAPIPGKKTVGIEVPNEVKQTVHFVDIVNRSMFKNAAMPLTVALGLDIEGKPVYAPIKSMPHGLIAGQTGSGKSVCINTILISLLLKYKPSELKMILIDPKMVELSSFNDIPHLLTPVITDAKAAAASLNWVVDEMERRFQAFRDVSARDIEAYNEKTEDVQEKLPYIVIVVDELADLMLTAGQMVEESIMRITQKARACGIHLILATQRPSTDIVKGTIKSNIPTRIAFSVSSHIDSQTIIDSAGAETLLGHGDMLYAPSGQSKQRLQGAFINDKDIDTIVNFIKNQAEANYLFNEDALVKNAAKTFEYDDLLDDVAYFVVNRQEASINKISKTFNIGFNRAQSIVESLEAAGIVSGNLGSKAREVLVDMDELDDILENLS